MSAQFGTYDNVADRRELVILFQRLGAGLPDPQARQLRARWLEKLVSKSLPSKWQVNPDMCHPVGAYQLFIQIVGVLGVDINTAAIALDREVSI